jgi:adenylate kinase
MNIVLLGLPGSGKGTQAVLLSQKLNLFYLATGDLARDWATKDPKIKGIVNSGDLIPEKEMTQYVMKHLNNNVPKGKGILFEGFPRFISQFEDYENWLSSRGQKVDYVFSLDIDEEETVKRISARRICERCDRVYNLITEPPSVPNKCDCGGTLIQRKDDDPSVVKTRYKVYKNNTKKLIDYLDSKQRLIHIDANRPVEDIFQDIFGKIK